MRDRIYPINVSVYKAPKSFVTGLVYSEAELEEIAGFAIDNNLPYAVAYREEEIYLTHESN